MFVKPASAAVAAATPAEVEADEVRVMTHCRRVLEEPPTDPAHRRGPVFNVRAGHECWAPNGNRLSSTVAVVMSGPQRTYYMCHTCGRTHVCRAPTCSADCPAVLAADEGNFVCGFSGRVIHDGNTAIGTYAGEQEARDAGTLSRLPPAHVDLSAMGVTTYTESHGLHCHLANVFRDGVQRRHERIADNARAMERSAHIINSYVSARRTRENRRPSRGRPALHARPPPVRAPTKEAVQSERNERVERMLDGDVDGDGDRGHARTEDSRVLLSSDNVPRVYTDREKARDAGFPARYFAPVDAVVAEVAALFEPLTTTSAAATPATTHGPPAVRPRGGKRARSRGEEPVRDQPPPKQQALEDRPVITNCVRHLVHLFDTARPDLVPSSLSTSWRVQYYATACENIIQLRRAGRSSAPCRNGVDIYRQVITILLDVMANDLRETGVNTTGVFIWMADPWLRQCRVHAVAADILRRHAAAKRADPVVVAARALPTALLTHLATILKNASHQGNKVRAALFAATQSGAALTTLLPSVPYCDATKRHAER